MSMILKMNIQGVRAFDPEKAASIEFGSPLTMIVGTNGCGKTTIIECLKFALAGSYPPGGTEKGKNFVHDPRVSGLTEVKANVKLRFYAKTGDRYVVFRYMNVKQNKTRQTFTQLDGVLSKVGEDGRKKMSHKCSELDRAVPLLLGVSKSVLESVVFCHQEESNWPLDGPKELKARFDDIFASSRYTTALTVLKKKRNDLHKQEIECLGDLKGLAGRKKHADSIRKMLNDADNEVKKAQEKLELYAQAKQKLNDHLLKLENNLRALNKKKNSINELKRVEQELNRNLNHIRVTAGTDGIFSDEAMSDADLQGHIDELQEEDDVLGTELDELEQQKATLEEQITTKRKQISDIDLELGSLRGKLDERANTISSLEIYIKQYSDKQNAMADSAASLIEYDETGIEKELELNFNKAQRLLKKTQNERDTATGDVAAHVAKCSAALESYQNGAKEAISKAHQLEADIRDINRQIRDALGNKHYDLAELRSHVQHLEEDLKQIENNAKEQVQKCDQAFATIDTELQEIENEEPKLRRQLKDEEDHHKELEKVRGHSDEMSAAQALAEKSKNEFKNLYIKSVKDIKHPLDLLASSSIPGGASLADDFMMNQEPPLLNTAEDQSLDKFIDYAEKIDRYISVQLEKEFTRREADAMQIEAHAKAEVKAANDSLRKIKVKLEKEQSKFDGDDHPQDILKAKRTKAGTLMRTVQKLFEKMTKSENEDPDQEGAVAADEDLYAEFFKESDDILKKTDCHNMTKDFDSQDNISFAPLHDTLSWYRSFLMSLKGFIAQIKAETELVGKYKQARDKGKCALCRRKVNDDDQKKKLDKQISKLEKSKEYEHEINLYIAQCENEIQSLVELENGAFRIWVDSTKIIQEVAADKEKCMQEQAQIDEDKEKASADLEKIRSAKNKIKEIQIYSKRLADLATDAKNKMQSFERMQQRYPSSLSNISSSKSTAKTVNEAITNINNIRNQQTTNAERKATLHAQRAMAERERNEAQSKINQKREEYNQNRINLDKAIDLDSRRTQVQKQAEELSNPTDNSKAKERELKNAADEAEIKRQDVIKEHGLKCEEVQKKVYAAQHELDKFANLKEAAIQAKKESDSIAEKINDLNKTRAELAREVKSVEKEIKSVDECMQVAGVSDETRAKLRNKVNTTGEYRKLRNDINQRKVHIDQENEELILLASKVEKEIKKYEKVAHKYDFNKKQINDDDDDDDDGDGTTNGLSNDVAVRNEIDHDGNQRKVQNDDDIQTGENRSSLNIQDQDTNFTGDEKNKRSPPAPPPKSATTNENIAHRMKIFEEILETETNYVRDLGVICHSFLIPIEKRELLKRDEIDKVFGNVSELRRIHEELLAKLRAAHRRHNDVVFAGKSSAQVAATDLARVHAHIFAEMIPFLRAYTVYCSTYTKAVELVRQLSSNESGTKNTKFSKFLQISVQSPQCRGLDLASFLIKPPQRLCKYPLFFRDLLKHMGNSAADRESANLISKTLDAVQDVTNAVNQNMASSGSQARVFEIFKNELDSHESVADLVSPTRRFLLEGIVDFASHDKAPKRHQFYLFNDLLLLATPRRGITGADVPNKFKIKHRFALVDVAITDAPACISLNDNDHNFLIRFEDQGGGSNSVHWGSHTTSATTTDSGLPSNNTNATNTTGRPARADFLLWCDDASQCERIRNTIQQACYDIRVLHEDIQNRRKSVLPIHHANTSSSVKQHTGIEPDASDNEDNDEQNSTTSQRWHGTAHLDLPNHSALDTVSQSSSNSRPPNSKPPPPPPQKKTTIPAPAIRPPPPADDAQRSVTKVTRMTEM